MKKFHGPMTLSGCADLPRYAIENLYSIKKTVHGDIINTCATDKAQKSDILDGFRSFDITVSI